MSTVPSSSSNHHHHHQKKKRARNDDDDVKQINIIFKHQGEKRYFSTKRDLSMSKVLKAFCDRRKYVYGSIHFLILGERFDHSKTPEQLGLENGVEIDVMVPVGGG